MNDSKKLFLFQALFVTFLWSASKIIIKLGLGFVSPYILIAAIQTVAFVVLLTYYFIKRPKLEWGVMKNRFIPLILIGLVGFVTAPLLSVIGIKYVTVTTAGLFAGLGAVLVVIFSFLILREKPRNVQIMGIFLAVLGVYIFLSGGFLGGSLFGIMIIFIAEVFYSLSTVLTRLVVRGPGDETMITSLFSTGIGAAILLPIGIVRDGVVGILQWQVLLVIVVVGIIFGFAGMLWSAVLDQLQAIEAAILQNTMLIQVALLSVIILKEHITLNNILGGAVVLLGAYLVEKQSLKRGNYKEGYSGT